MDSQMIEQMRKERHWLIEQLAAAWGLSEGEVAEMVYRDCPPRRVRAALNPSESNHGR
jgi:hypothetical protein